MYLAASKWYINADVGDAYNIPRKSRPFIFADADVKDVTDSIVLADESNKNQDV